MDENLSKNKKNFWPSSKDWIWSKWPLMTRAEKTIYICSILFLFSLFALNKSKVLNNLTRQEFSIFMVIVWVIALLLMVWDFKVRKNKKRDEWADTNFLRVTGVVIMVVLFFFILGFYLQLY